MRSYRLTLICGALAASIANFLFAAGAFTQWTADVFGPGPFPLWPQWAGAIALGFGLAWTTAAIRAHSLKLAVAAAALIETAVLSWLLALRGVAWPPFATLTAGGLATLFAFLHGISRRWRHIRQIEDSLGASVSPATLERVLASANPFPFQGCEREATAVVCRCFNRREMAETLPAADFVALTNAFSAVAAQALKEAGGVIIESGDEHVHAVFGALLGDGGHAARAGRALLVLAPQLEAFRRRACTRWGVEPDCRAAAETGVVIAGIFGQPGAGGFGAVGEPIETARHLAQANQFYGTRLLMGSRAFLKAGGAIDARPADLVWNRNVREEIYEPLGLRGELSPEALARRDAYWLGVVNGRCGNASEAKALLEPLLKDEAGNDDPLVRSALDLASTLE